MPSDQDDLDLRAQFMRYWKKIEGPYRYVPTKYKELLRSLWPEVKRLAMGEKIQKETLSKPHHFEIHPTECCQLTCRWCREEPRSVPKKQIHMDRVRLLQLIESVFSMSPQAFIRISGTIGEPLLNPDVVAAFELMNRRKMHWGLTTNGLRLNMPGVIPALVKADYAHISLDAGSEGTYRSLKKGRAGDFEKVLGNVAALARAKARELSEVEIIVSVILQSENFRELRDLSRHLKSIGANALELKMQHFDKHRMMNSEEIDEAYRLIDEVVSDDSSGSYRVVRVQDLEEALVQITNDSRPKKFEYCYSGGLGLSATVDPHSNLQSCCQYYQSTLGTQGEITNGLSSIWDSEKRATILNKCVKGCVGCSPSDHFVNSFIGFLCHAYKQNPLFLTWIETFVRETK